MPDILPIRPRYDTTAAVEYHATVGNQGKHIVRCERVDETTARRLGLPITYVPDANQWWLVSLIDPSGRVTYLTAAPCDSGRSATAE
jgi:hypothetical protein